MSRKFIDIFLKEHVFPSKPPSMATVEIVRAISKSMIGRSRSINVQRKGNERTVTENVEFMIPRVLGENAKNIRDKLFALTDFERMDLYRALSMSEDGGNVLKVAEKSIMEQSPNTCTEEQLREVASMRIYAILKRFAEDLRSLLVHTAIQRTQGPVLRIQPAEGYPIGVVQEIAKRAKSLTRPDITYSETMALLPAEAPAHIEGLPELFQQLRKLQLGTQEERDSMTREIVTAKTDIRSQPLLSSLSPVLQKTLIDFLVLLRECNEKSASKSEDRDKQRAIRTMLSAIPSDELEIILSTLERCNSFTAELDGMDEKLWKESVGNTDIARLLLHTRWHRSPDLSSQMKQVLMLLSQEWGFVEYDRDRPLQKFITPVRYTKQTYDAAREILQAMQKDGSFAGLELNESLALNQDVIADVLKIQSEHYHEEYLDPVSIKGKPEQEGTPDTTKIPNAIDDREVDPACLRLTETGLALLQLPGDDAIKITQNTLRLRPLEKVGDRLSALYGSITILENRIESVREVKNASSMILSGVFQLTGDFQQVISAMTRSCIVESSAIGSGDSPELSPAEIIHFKQILLRSSLDLHAIFQSIPTRKLGVESLLHDAVMDSLMSSAAQHIVSVRIQEQWGKRLQRFPAMTHVLSYQLDRITNDVATAALELPEDQDAAGESLFQALSVVMQGLQEMLESTESFDPQNASLDLLEKKFIEMGIPFESSIAAKNPNPATEKIESPERSDRRIIAKYLRYKYHNTRARISFSDAQEFLRPAGIVAKERHTEHPWYWVCEGERAGRSAISHGFAANGFYHGSILNLLFGSHDFKGIGNIQALIDSLPEKWKSAIPQKGSASPVNNMNENSVE